MGEVRIGCCGLDAGERHRDRDCASVRSWALHCWRGRRTAVEKWILLGFGTGCWMLCVEGGAGGGGEGCFARCWWSGRRSGTF